MSSSIFLSLLLGPKSCSVTIQFIHTLEIFFFFFFVQRSLSMPWKRLPQITNRLRPHKQLLQTLHNSTRSYAQCQLSLLTSHLTHLLVQFTAHMPCYPCQRPASFPTSTVMFQSKLTGASIPSATQVIFGFLVFK